MLIGLPSFINFGSWAFSKSWVPYSAGPWGMPMSVAPEILLESKNQGKSPSLQLTPDFFELSNAFHKSIIYCTGIMVIGAGSSDGSGTS